MSNTTPTQQPSREDEKPSHTPGPWRYLEDGVGPAITQPGYRVIWGPRGSGRWERSSDQPLEIARTRKVESAEVDANWRLMAAAPQLLAACVAALDQLQRFADAKMTDEVQQHFDAETVKARGALCDAIASATVAS